MYIYLNLTKIITIAFFVIQNMLVQNNFNQKEIRKVIGGN